MRKLTVLLATVFALLLGAAALFYFGGTLRAQPYIRTASAAEHPEAYDAIRDLLTSGSAPQVFDGAALPGDPADCTLADITVELTNWGLFPAEWLDIRAEGVPGDIAVYALTGEGGDIPARGKGQVNLKLITTARADAQRRVFIQYYVHGMRREIEVR